MAQRTTSMTHTERPHEVTIMLSKTELELIIIAMQTADAAEEMINGNVVENKTLKDLDNIYKKEIW